MARLWHEIQRIDIQILLESFEILVGHGDLVLALPIRSGSLLFPFLLQHSNAMKHVMVRQVLRK
jgi:hypothetical protein